MADSRDTYRTVTPYLVVSDADAELAFLKAAFGAVEVNCQRNPDNTVMHAEITIGDSLVMLGQAGGSWTPRTTALYLWVEDVDATYARALEAGATSESEPRRQTVRPPKRRSDRPGRGHLVDWRAGPGETDSLINSRPSGAPRPGRRGPTPANGAARIMRCRLMILHATAQCSMA